MRAYVVRFGSAVAEGLVFSAKWTVALLIPALVFYLLASDYLVVRSGAAKGTAAFDYIDKSIQQQQAAAKSAPAVESPAKPAK